MNYDEFAESIRVACRTIYSNCWVSCSQYSRPSENQLNNIVDMIVDDYGSRLAGGEVSEVTCILDQTLTIGLIAIKTVYLYLTIHRGIGI